MDRLRAISVFAAIIEEGSFAGAADRLGLSRTAASKHVMQLETHLGVTLFTRTTRRVSPTDAGMAYYSRIKPALEEISDADAEASVFTSFGPSGFLKMLIDMIAPAQVKNWAARRLSPKLEMFFAPTVINELLAKWGREQMDNKSDGALTAFVDAAIDGGWISVKRAETPEEAQSAYRRIFEGKVPPSEALILSLN